MTSVGIARWGVYVPRNRLPVGKAGEAARAVAGPDEDAITLAVAAARECLNGYQGEEPSALLFASTCAPYAQKQAAATVVAALGLTGVMRSVDVAGSLRAGSDALQLACDIVASGASASVLVVIADCPIAAPGSPRERVLGDAAVAFLISEHPVAALQSRYLHTDSLLDTWRVAGDRFQHQWEDRFVTLHGWREALLPLLQEALTVGPVHALALSAPDARAQRELANALQLTHGLDPGTSIWQQVGHCGTALSSLLLVAALEQVNPGETLLQADYGDGASVLRWQCQQAVPRKVLEQALHARRRTVDYAWYLRAKELLPGEYPPPLDQGIPATVHFRERAEDLGLIGQVCICGTPQFPRGRICQHCGAVDQFTPRRYAEATGEVVTYTHDAFFPSAEPPTTAAIIQVRDGPRIHLQLAEVAAKAVTIGLPVEFAFRCIHRSGGKPNYFWKAIPISHGEAL